MRFCRIFSTAATVAALHATVAFAGAGRESALIILDTSGSMSWNGSVLVGANSCALKSVPRVQGTGMVAPNRFEHAQRVTGETVERFQKKGLDMGLIVFGQGPCDKIDLMVQLGGDYAGRAIESAIQGLKPAGLTPIAQSLKTAAEYIRNGGYNVKEVVLVTDGIETCRGDAKAAARELRKLGAKVSIVGLDTAGAMSAQLQELANEGGGTFEERFAVGAGGDHAEPGGVREVAFDNRAGLAPRAYVQPSSMAQPEMKIWMPPSGGNFPDEKGTRIKY